ncbi:MAG: ribonuclease HI [Candidatus Competibacterales bacterium]
MKQVVIYTDGGCKPNPGPGGCGVVLLYGDQRRELSEGFRRSTNNRMEITAAIVGLEALKQPCQVTLHSDSQYLVNAMTQGWVERWRANGWRRNKTARAKNPDLWQRLLAAAKPHQVTYVWVRGHAGDPLNERCDALASAAIQRAIRGENPAIDAVFERQGEGEG